MGLAEAARLRSAASRTPSPVCTSESMAQLQMTRRAAHLEALLDCTRIPLCHLPLPAPVVAGHTHEHAPSARKGYSHGTHWSTSNSSYGGLTGYSTRGLWSRATPASMRLARAYPPGGPPCTAAAAAPGRPGRGPLAAARDLGVGPGQTARCSQLRQRQTGNARFIAQSKNKTLKWTIVLSESDMYFKVVFHRATVTGGHWHHARRRNCAVNCALAGASWEWHGRLRPTASAVQCPEWKLGSS